MLPEIPGDVCNEGYQRHLKSIVADLFQSRHPDKFPGAQPISFAAHHLDELENENYFVSEKADGIRVLLFTHMNRERNKPESFLIDRKNNYYYNSFWIPCFDDIDKPVVNTVLDCELVLDVDEEKNEKTLWLLLFDCVIYAGKQLMERPYTSRLGASMHFMDYLKEKVLKPFKKKLSSDPSYKKSLPFQMDLKKLELSYGLGRVFEEMPKLKHKSDGIIFTSSVAPYTLGTCSKMLKWKPSDENTVDFKISVRGDPQDPDYMLCLWRGGREHEDFDLLTLEPDLKKSWLKQPPNGRIAECRYDPLWPGFWRFMRWRDDKANANHYSTYEKIMESIRDNVDKQDLLDRVPTIRNRWKQRNGN